MSEQFEQENKDALATISAYITFPYIWIGLFVGVAALYRVGFFGANLGSLIVPGLLCLVLLSPAIPFALVRMVIKPSFGTLLGRQVISAPGCMVGISSIVIAFFAILYFISRGVFDTAGILFLAAPLGGALLAGVLSLLGRIGGGGALLPAKRRHAPSGNATPISIEKPAPRSLPGSRKPPSLPSAPQKPQSLPSSNRQSRPSSSPSSSSRRPPPPRRR